MDQNQMSAGKLRKTLDTPYCTAGNLEALAHMIPDKAIVDSVFIATGPNPKTKNVETTVTINYKVHLIGAVSTGDGMLPVAPESIKGLTGTGSSHSSIDADGSIGKEVDDLLAGLK